MTGTTWRTYGWGLSGPDFVAHQTLLQAQRGQGSALTRDLRAMPASAFRYPTPGGEARSLLTRANFASTDGRPEALVTVLGRKRVPDAVIFYPDLAHREYWLRHWPGTRIVTVSEPPVLTWLDEPATPDEIVWYLTHHALIDADGIARLRPVRAQWEDR